MNFTGVKINPKSVCNKKQSRKDIQRNHICSTGSDHVFILDEIKRKDTIYYDRKMSVDDRCE